MSKLLRARAVSFLAIAHACLYLLSVTLVLVVESPTVAGQGPWDCHHVPVAMDLPDPQGFIAAPLPALCTEGIGGGGVSNSNLPDGVYIKAGTPLRIDTEAHTTGTCYQYAFDWWNWICYYTGIAEMQPLWKDDVFTTPPAPPGSTNTFYAAYPSRSLDTRDGQGLQTGFTDIGEYLFRFQSGAYPTACTDVMYSLLVPKTAVVVACLPNWRPSTGTLPQLPTDGQDITLVYSSGLDSAIAPAVQSWNDELSRLGLTVPHFRGVPGGACAQSDPHCVFVDVSICPNLPTACGCTMPTPVQGGVYATSTTIHLRTGFDTWPPAARQWTVAHELGHVLDLGEQGTVGMNSQCNDSDSIMHSPVVCGDVGPLTGPTDSDGFAVVRTPYGAGPKTTCG